MVEANTTKATNGQPAIQADSMNNFDPDDVIIALFTFDYQAVRINQVTLGSPGSNKIGSNGSITDFRNMFLRDYADVFSSRDFPTLPPRREGVDMKIELLPGKLPPFGPIYSLSRQEEEALRTYIEEALKAGIIQPSRSSAGSPVMFVKKKDGSLRLCVDYRGLNAVTETDRSALPIIKDMLQRTFGCQYFSKVDLKSAFNLIRISEGSEHLTAFRSKYGLFEYLVMPFGLKNAPGHFQAFINCIFSDLIDRGLLAYIDDLLIYAKTRQEHDEVLRIVFERLKTPVKG
jgi:hypothetical protein